MNETDRLVKICDALSDLILGGERGWEELDFDTWVQICRSTVASRNIGGLQSLRNELDQKNWKGKNEIWNHAITNVQKRISELLEDGPKEEFYILKPLVDGFKPSDFEKLAPFEGRPITISGLCYLPIPVVPVEVSNNYLYVRHPHDY